jgi:hypothetical protein
MGFIPKGARWYLADIVLEHVIEGERRNLVHVNRHLVEAASPEEAYKKASKLGRENQLRYLNTDGMRVRLKFRGLRELNVIHDDLEDGAELSYEEVVAVPESTLKRWATPKKELGVFAPRRPRRGGPNYMPLTIMRELEAAGFSRADLEGRPKRAHSKRPPSSGRPAKRAPSGRDRAKRGVVAETRRSKVPVG